ncbi:MAG: type IV secretion system DNA-binding domain-containing protein, partial [Gammaproteobacteria bacterium]|nr:type IV secretion system DNA-binding domain-containing protein [Gammaproteobacteria bacterium]
YGNNGAETLSGLARTRVILSTPDKSTADWCSQALGNEEKTELQETLSYGAHEMRDGVSLATRNQLQPIVLPTEIMSLPDLTGFLRLPQGFPVARFTIEPNSTPTKVKSFVERLNEPVQTGEVRISPPIPDTKPQKKVDRQKKPEPKEKPTPERKQNPEPAPKAKQKSKPKITNDEQEEDLLV